MIFVGLAPRGVICRKGKRTLRVACSTLVQKGVIGDTGVDSAMHLAKLPSEMLPGEPAARSKPIFEVLPVPDWQSLYDAPRKLTSSFPGAWR